MIDDTEAFENEIHMDTETMRLRQIVSLDVYRSSRPGYPRLNVARHTLDKAVNELRQYGISTVVCLLTDGESFKYYGLDLARFYRRNAKFNVHRFPIPDFGVPRTSFMLDMCREIDKHQKKLDRVLLHCSAGIGRTGMALNCYATYRELMYRESPIIFDGSETTEQFNFQQMFRVHVKKYIKSKRGKK